MTSFTLTEPRRHDPTNNNDENDDKEPADVTPSTTADYTASHRTQSDRDDKKEAEAEAAVSPANQQTASDWQGLHDPDNPLNWPLFKKALVILGASLLAFSTTAASSIISPGVTAIQNDFNVSRTAAIVPLSVYVLGLALGPAVGAPISETQGRSLVYKLSGLLCMLFLLGAGFSTSLASLIVCRFLAGFFGGPVLAIVGGTTADLIPAHQRAISSACVVMSAFLGPCFGPVIGGFAAQYKSWQWTQWCAIFLVLPGFAICMFAPETYKKIVLRRKAKKLGIPGPPAPPVQGLAALKMLFTITLARPVIMLVAEPIVTAFALYNGFTFAVLFSFFAAYPYVFVGVYGFEIYQYGLVFISIGVGVVLGTALMILIDHLMYKPRHHAALKAGRPIAAPEHRLYIAMMGSPLVPLGLFWFAWTADPSIHWISPVLASIPFACGNCCVFYGATMYLIDVYGPLNGASAMAANGISRYVLGAAFPLFTVQMYERLGIGWATSLLGFVSVALCPIPWVLFRYGPGLRARSRYECLRD